MNIARKMGVSGSSEKRADSLDFVNRPAHFELVVTKIQAKLAGK